jgi:ubiquinone/menaquinone biosynthesis C-methylase UbiE
MNQEEVWDAIADKWKEFREEPQEEVKNFLKNKSGKFLDLGCGSGRNFKALSKEATIFGVDFSSQMLVYAKEQIDKLKVNGFITKASATKLSFENNFFDCAIFIATLHCLETPQERKKALTELYRVLKPNSPALVSVWSTKQKRINGKLGNCYIPWSVKGKKYERFYYIYKKEELSKLLEEIGFVIISSEEKENIIFEINKP